MKIVPGKIAAEIKGKWTVYGAATVQKAWKDCHYGHIQLICLDPSYRALSEDDWNKVLIASDTRVQKYSEPWFDCDKFSRLFQAEVQSLMVNGVAMIIDFDAKHSFNALMVAGASAPSWKIMEPQADQWVVANSKPYYNMKGGGIAIL